MNIKTYVCNQNITRIYVRKATLLKTTDIKVPSGVRFPIKFAYAPSAKFINEGLSSGRYTLERYDPTCLRLMIIEGITGKYYNHMVCAFLQRANGRAGQAPRIFTR